MKKNFWRRFSGFNLFNYFLLFCILLFSFLFNFESGRRGFFPLDQSIVFDGSYRILKGQIPYRDFIIPCGLLPFYLHSIFFKIFGISYSSYLIGSSFINLLATILCFFIISFLFPSKKWLSFIGAFITAIWFYPPSGTPYIEQTSFSLSFFGIYIILIAIFSERISSFFRKVLILLSGFVAFTAFLCKQNAGIFILPVYFLIFLSSSLSDFKKLLSPFLYFLIGFLLASILFSLWLILISDFKIFFKYTLITSTEIGMERLSPVVFLLKFFRSSRALLFANLIIIISCIYFIIIYLKNFKKEAEKELERIFASSILCLYLIFFHYLFISTTKNQPEMELPFLGLNLSLGTGLIFNLSKWLEISLNYNGKKLRLPSKKTVNIFLLSIFSFVLLYFSLKGINVSLRRSAHDIFEFSNFNETFKTDELRVLKWGNPTRIRGCEVKIEDIERLIDFLKKEKKDFFIFPDFTFLYGVLKTTPPQPILWFHKGLTYPLKYAPYLDNWIVRDLKKNNIGIFIFEECSWFGTEKTINSFPLLKKFIEENFKEISRFGMFKVLVKNF
ncbi:MAG: ArnT family glycosyltransferase [Candidatus Aminicenantia bacterium]